MSSMDPATQDLLAGIKAAGEEGGLSVSFLCLCEHILVSVSVLNSLRTSPADNPQLPRLTPLSVSA